VNKCKNVSYWFLGVKYPRTWLRRSFSYLGMSESWSISVNGRLGSACPANSLRQEIRNESHAASSSGSLASVSFILRRVPPCNLSVSVGDFSLFRTTLFVNAVAASGRINSRHRDQFFSSRPFASFVDLGSTFYFFFLFSSSSAPSSPPPPRRRISPRSPHFC